ncbi:MAG: PAS domain S-box protein, partial [Bacteroidetes bacterium]|nr:PAS domain S-box protein [Bacteroidota bacterium]
TYPAFYNGEPIFGSKRGIYRFDPYKSVFYCDTVFYQGFYSKEMTIHRLYGDYSGNLWFVGIYEDVEKGDEFLIGYLSKTNGNNYKMNSDLFSGINREIKHSIFSEETGITWIGGTDGLYRYDIRYKNIGKAKFSTLIRKVIINKDSVIFNGNFTTNKGIIIAQQPENMIPGIDYKYNSIRIYFSSPGAGKTFNNQYIYMLDGHDNDWSDWENMSYKDYTNISEGKYTFRVKSRNLYKQEGSEVSYRFEILPPWYRTIWAFAGYLVIVVLAIYITIRVYTIRLRAKNIRLEKIIRDRTKEIQEKNIILEKLSIVASETDNSVIIADSDGKIEWVNEGFTRLTGYTLDEYIAEKGSSFIETSGNTRLPEIINECVSQKKSAVYITQSERKTGEELWIQTTFTPVFYNDGTVKKYVAIDSDITKIKKAEEEISYLYDLAVQRQDEITRQRDHIAEQQKEIMDSIRYAKRIQAALLPSDESIRSNMPDCFVLFKPRDVVSGDFYWSAKIRNYFIICVADCTGHGVPGAFMSMLGISFLNDIVRKEEVTQASHVLDQLRQYIIVSLKQTGEDRVPPAASSVTQGIRSSHNSDRAKTTADQKASADDVKDMPSQATAVNTSIQLSVKDGMDIALVVFDAETKILQFAGANNPLWLIKRENVTKTDTFENIEDIVTEIKGDKMPVAIHVIMQPFKNHEIQLEPADAFYIFSDGFPDQFGGPKGKKFKYGALKRLLVENQNKSMPGQKKILSKVLTEWMAHTNPVTQKPYEQIDDICVIGMRV